jgi:hypothetical protein
LTLCLQRERGRGKKNSTVWQKNCSQIKCKAQSSKLNTISDLQEVYLRFWWEKLVLWKREREIERFPFQWCTYTLRSSWISKKFRQHAVLSISPGK